MDIRGVPEHVESDNAKTFIRVSKEFQSIFSSNRARKFFQQKRINWHFYLERAEWQGGFIERLNGIFKNICKKTFAKAILTFEEFRSMASFAMSIMNSRPLTYVYSDINSEGIPLTPSLLMLGFNVSEPPHLSLRKKTDQTEMSLGESYKFLESLKDTFWNLWQKEYLTELFERHSKEGKTPGKIKIPKVDDVVLIRGENTPRRCWKLGRILEVKSSSRDGQCRECKVQTLSPGEKKTVISSTPR